jgi:glycosyltransferase involved in cell wall biosynthesis
MDTPKPLVTIGIPTFNRANSYLRASLESALSQTYSAIEIIVSDNCSTDSTSSLVASYRDERVRYYKHPSPVVPHESADFCLREARGGYFLLLHDDDLIDIDFIEVCLAAIQAGNAGLARTGVRKIDGAGRVLGERVNPHGQSTLFGYLEAILRGEAVTYFCNSLYATSALREVGGFTSGGFAYQDVIATIKVACRYGRVDLSGAKASYRVHDSKLGGTTNIIKWCDDSLEIIEVMVQEMPRMADYFRRTGRRRLGRRNFDRAAKIRSWPKRLDAYWLVYRKFGFLPLGLWWDRLSLKVFKEPDAVSANSRCSNG